MCCRGWTIEVSAAEQTAGRLETQRTCRLTKKPCDKDYEECAYLFFELQRDADGVCVHLGEDDRCTVYEARPRICRDFTCQGGWRLASVLPLDDRPIAPAAPLDKPAFVKRLSDSMTFVTHPLIKLQSVFYVKARDEISFLKKMVGSCGAFYTRESFHYPQLDDELALELIRLFESKDTLGEVFRRFCEGHDVGLARREFDEIVWVLNRHGIILEARNFEGMLAGVGGI